MLNKIFDFTQKNIIYLLVIFLVTAFSSLILINQLGVKIKAPVRADAIGYYSYLPAIFIKQDLGFKFMFSTNFENTQGMNSYEGKYSDSEASGMGFHQQENGNYLNKYPIGVAVLLTPFYLTGSALNLIFDVDNYGFSFFQQYSVFIGGVFYFILGIFFLLLALRKLFADKVVFLSLLCVILCTNLLNYAGFENLFSHIYSFALLSMLLFVISSWYAVIENSNHRRFYIYCILIGLILGLLVLVRQTNLIYFLIPLFYFISNQKLTSLKNLYKSNFLKSFIIIFAIMLVIALIQSLYWIISIDRAFVFSYTGEGFSLINAHFWESLISPTRGVFFWAPILVFGLIGIIASKKLRNYRYGFLSVLITIWIIVSTWSSWTFGWGYGHRMFVDVLPIFAFGLAGFWDLVFKSNKKALKFLLLLVALLFALLSIYNTIQYQRRVLPPQVKNLTQYFEVLKNPKLGQNWWK